MLKLFLSPHEAWDEKAEEFRMVGGMEVELEHSLYTVSLWESKWKKPFADKKSLGRRELLDYIVNCMCQTPDVPKTAWLTISQDDIQKVKEYMEDSACATTVHHSPGQRGGRKETVTAELLYFYMAQFNIPLEFQHWHLNRLMTLIDVAAVKNSPPKKMAAKDAAAQWAKVNAERRAKTGSRG